MSFKLQECYGYGTGHNFTDYEVEKGEVFDNFNSYALVTEIDRNLITIDLEHAYLGQFEKFEAGNVILLHASASPTLKINKLGKFIAAKIEVADNGRLTLDKNIEETFAAEDLLDYKIQAVTFANFHCLKIYGAVTPQRYSSTSYHGGILAIKCSDFLQLEGNIDLADCGISPYQKNYLRPLLPEELNPTKFTKENFCDDNVFPLNSGDGAAFIFAKYLTSTENARIGFRGTHGKNDCRGDEPSVFKPSNVTNVGGSSILIVCEKENISAVNLAKYRAETSSDALKGKGLARCYIATREPFTKFDDEKLYHADLISDPARFSYRSNFFDFGSGVDGDVENPIRRINKAFDFLKLNKSVGLYGNVEPFYTLTDLYAGTKILFLTGMFPMLNEIKVNTHYHLILKDNLPQIFERISWRKLKAITVPQFNNLTINIARHSEEFAVLVKEKFKLTAQIYCKNAFIFANEIEFGSAAKIGGNVFICANKITGWSDTIAEKPTVLLVNDLS